MGNKEIWNQFMKDNQACFLQSQEWAKFQQALGNKVWQLSFDKIKALVIKQNFPLNKNFLYIPRGPVIQGKLNQAESEVFFNKVKQIAKQEKSIFLKIEPKKDFQFSNFKPGIKQIQPKQTIILDLTNSAEELLNQMHQKTRYNIRLAAKKGVQIEFSQSQDYLNKFIDLQEKTAQRDAFSLHPKEYYQKLFSVLKPKEMIELAVAKYQGEIIAINLILYFNQFAYYLYGASDYNYRQVMAPYLLQWETIKRAQEKKYQIYDFWGIDENKWPGVTRFKQGFKGKKISYPGSFDLIFRPAWYMLYQTVRKFL